MDGVKVALGSRVILVCEGRCSMTMKDRKDWRALVHMYKIEFHVTIFARFPCSFDRTPVLWWLITWRVVGRRWDNCEKDATTDIMEQVPSIWAHGSLLQVHGHSILLSQFVLLMGLITAPQKNHKSSEPRVKAPVAIKYSKEYYINTLES